MRRSRLSPDRGRRLFVYVSAYGATVASMVQGIITASLLARHLSMEEYGVWSQVRAVAMLATTFLSLNLGHGFLRFGATSNHRKRSQILRIVLILQLLMCGITFSAFLPWHRYLADAAFGRPSLALFVGAFALALVSMTQSQLRNALIVTNRATMSYLLLTVLRLAMIVGVIIVVLVWPTVTAALTMSILVTLVVAISAAWLIRDEFKANGGESNVLGKLLKFCLPLFPVQLALWVCVSSDRFYLKHYLGLEAVARYSIVYSFSGLVYVLFSALSSVFLVSLVPVYEAKKYGRVGEIVGLTVRVYWTIGLAAVAAMVVGGDGIVRILGGKKYVFNDLQAVVLSVAVGSFLFGVYQIVSRLYDLEKRMWSISALWTSAMLVNLLLNAIFIPSYGVLGAAIATAVSYGATFLAAVFLRPRRVRVRLKILPLVSHAVVTICILFAALCAPITGKLLGILGAIVCFAIVVVLAFVCRVVRVDELRAAIRS